MSEPTHTPTSGVDTTEFDPSIRAQDDLFRHVNGHWLATHAIPADRGTDGSFRALHDQAEADVRAIVDELGARGTGEGVGQQIGDLYRSFMDTDRIEDLGLEPIRPMLDLIDAAASHDDLAVVLGTLSRRGGPTLVGFWVDNDADDPDRYVVYLMQAGLGLPDEAYYRLDEHAHVRTAYVAHIDRLHQLADLPEADNAGATLLELETALASHHWDVVKDRDAEATYNPTALAELAQTAPGFPWERWAQAVCADHPHAMDSVVVREPSYATAMAQLWASRPLEEWKRWARFHLVRRFAPFLTDALVQANFDFYGRVLSGTEQLRDRWKRGVALVEGALGEAVGQEYVARHFPPAHKARMEALVSSLVEAYRRSITTLEWMSPATRAKALDKLAAFTPKIGYPDRWRDYSGLVVRADDLVGNVTRSNEFDTDWTLGKIGQPIDRAEWLMTPQTVNAYYNPGMNEIVFPAAILQPPFFTPDADDAVNYGGIGAVIGHEIGHGFDDQGSKYDGSGRLADWWTPQDRAEFERRTQALIAQYSAFVPAQFAAAGEPHVNGALTIGENIGDLGGLSIAIAAYEIATGHSLADGPVIDGMTAGERLFFGWAQVWREKSRDAALAQRIATDPHSPAEFRCNGVARNVDAFYDVFGVVEGDGLYLDPAQRVRIW